MLSIRIESAATRMRPFGGVATSARAAMAPVSAYDAGHKLLPTADVRGDAQWAQCAWDPPV